ncbi:MAG: hypothetical protein WKF40_00670 [Thermoleophilaceae bacterium]
MHDGLPGEDLAEGKVWWSQLLERAPYFDEPYYVGFDVNGCEVGLVPSTGDDGPTTYWRVLDADAADVTELLAAGAVAHEEPRRWVGHPLGRGTGPFGQPRWRDPHPGRDRLT